jgi:hypothetical protein
MFFNVVKLSSNIFSARVCHTRTDTNLYYKIELHVTCLDNNFIDAIGVDTVEGMLLRFLFI